MNCTSYIWFELYYNYSFIWSEKVCSGGTVPPNQPGSAALI